VSKLDSDHRVALNLFMTWVVRQLTTGSESTKNRSSPNPFTRIW